MLLGSGEEGGAGRSALGAGRRLPMEKLGELRGSCTQSIGAVGHLHQRPSSPVHLAEPTVSPLTTIRAIFLGIMTASDLGRQ